MTTNHTLKTEVRSLLKYGRENAVTGKELARTLGYPNDRVIRQAIRELIGEIANLESRIATLEGGRL